MSKTNIEKRARELVIVQVKNAARYADDAHDDGERQLEWTAWQFVAHAMDENAELREEVIRLQRELGYDHDGPDVASQLDSARYMLRELVEASLHLTRAIEQHLRSTPPVATKTKGREP